MYVKLRFSAWAIAAVASITTAAATPLGNLSIANVVGGGVLVNATRIDWYPTTNQAPSPVGTGDFSTGGFTSISYSGGTLTAATNPYGQIRDIDVSTGSIPNFIQFYTSTTLPSPPGTGALQPAPVFDLLAVLPGGTAQGALENCAGVNAVGVSCSPLVSFGVPTPYVSPFVLTNRGAYTDVSLGVLMLGRDATGSVEWFGGFTTQLVGLTPGQVQAMINSGLSIDNTWSATFTGIPEPTSMALFGSGLLLLGLIRRRLSR